MEYIIISSDVEDRVAIYSSPEEVQEHLDLYRNRHRGKPYTFTIYDAKVVDFICMEEGEPYARP